MSESTVTQTGLDELRRNVEAFPKAFEQSQRAVAWRTSRRILAGAQRRVAVDTGYTRDHIHIVEDVEHRQFIVNAGTDRPKVRLSLHISKRSGRMHTQKVTQTNVPLYLEYGTSRMAARPFMRPAADAERDQYTRESEQAAIAIATEKLG